MQQDDQRPFAGLDVMQPLIADLGVAFAKVAGRFDAAEAEPGRWWAVDNECMTASFSSWRCFTITIAPWLDALNPCRTLVGTRAESRPAPRGRPGICGQPVLWSSLREVMPSLANTFLRCHSTVRALMNSSAAISGLVRPSRASRTMCSSCGVSWL